MTEAPKGLIGKGGYTNLDPREGSYKYLAAAIETVFLNTDINKAIAADDINCLASGCAVYLHAHVHMPKPDNE